MIRVNFSLDLDLFLSNGHLHAETILVTTEYRFGTDMLVYQEVGETTQALSRALFIIALHMNNGLCNKYFFYRKTYGMDKPKKLSRRSFLERIGTFKHDETDISQEALLTYRYIDRHGREDSANIVVNRNKNRKSTAYIDFADMNEYVRFCPPDWLTEFKASDEDNAGAINHAGNILERRAQNEKQKITQVQKLRPHSAE